MKFLKTSTTKSKRISNRKRTTVSLNVDVDFSVKLIDVVTTMNMEIDPVAKLFKDTCKVLIFNTISTLHLTALYSKIVSWS